LKSNVVKALLWEFIDLPHIIISVRQRAIRNRPL